MAIKNRYTKVYAQELKRIEKQIKKLLSQGYAISIDIPKAKKTPTKSDVQRLKKITLNVIQKSAEALISGNRYKAKKRTTKKKIKKTPTQTEQIIQPSNADIIIDNFIQQTYTYFPVAERMCRQWLENSLKNNGKEATAEALASVPWLTIHESYDAESNGGHIIVPEFLSELSSNLGLSKSQQKEFLESFDYENGWGEY